MKSYTGPWASTNYSEQPRQRKMDVRCGTWNVQSL